MCAATWAGVRRVPFTESTTIVTDFWPASLASFTTRPANRSAVRSSSSRGLPTPSNSKRETPERPSTAKVLPLAPVKRLADIARATAPDPPSIALAVARSCLSAPTKAVTLPEKAFGKAENSTFIQVPSLCRRFFAPATVRRKSLICCKCSQIRGGVPAQPTVSVPALKTGTKMTSGTLPRVNVVGLGKLGAPLAAVLASRGFTVIGLDVNKVLVDALNAGKMPIVEPQLNELIAANKKNLSATMDANEAIQKSDA